MRPRSLLLLVSLLVAAPLFASKHTWIGGSSNRFSDAANWSGGAPAGDPDAELLFDAPRRGNYVVNDVAGLRFKTLQIFGDYIVAGAPLQTTGGTIETQEHPKLLCDLAIEGTLKITGIGEPDLGGAISGSGGIEIFLAAAHFSGVQPNTYAGETLVHAARLILEKVRTIAVPGTLRATRDFQSSGIYVNAAEQIADSATAIIADGAGTLFLAADETLRSLQLSGDVASNVPAGAPLPTLTILDSLTIGTGNVNILTNLRVAQSILDVPKNTNLEIRTGDGKGRFLFPDSGITVRGAGNVYWNGDAGAPIHIDGVYAGLLVPNAPVELISGVFNGKAGSLTASGGRIEPGTVVTSDVRLGPAVTLHVFASDAQTSASLELNGRLELNDATLDVLSGSGVIINNKSSQPVVGTFKGVAEGGLAMGRWRVSYHGGSGNDVTITEVQRPQPAVVVTQDPNPGFVGEPVTLTVTVSASGGPVPTGSVSFQRSTGETLGPVALSGGKASLQVTLPTPEQYLYVRYLGDDVYASTSATTTPFLVNYRKPVIASIEPPEVVGGSKVPLIIRGANFIAGSTLPGISFSGTQVVSSTEIHTTLDLTQTRLATTLQITVTAGTLVSDPKPLPVREPSQPDSPIRFDATTASMTVTPHAKTVWLTTGVSSSRLTQFLIDDDGDGLVTWLWPSIPNEIFAAVDLTSGNYAVRGGRAAVADVQPFPAHTFNRGGTFVLPLGPTFPRSLNLLWARPGTGAWLKLLSDGDVDDDHLFNRSIVSSIAGMRALGDSPAPPASFAAGDVVIAVPMSVGIFPGGSSVTVPVFASRLGAELDDPAPGVLQALAESWTFGENAKVAKLPVLRTGGGAGTVSVRYHTVDPNFAGGVYFVPTSGTLTFAPGETLKSIEIPLIDDTTWRGYTASFNVALSDPAGGAALGDETQFVVTITDDDPPPIAHVVGPTEIHVARRSVPTKLPLLLRLTTPALVPLHFEWRVDGALGGDDVFLPGEMLKTAVVTIPALKELHSSPIVVDFFGASGDRVGIYLDDFEGLHARADDAVVAENGGVAHVRVTLDPAARFSAGVGYSTQDGTAVAGKDYEAKSGSLTLSPSQPQQTIDVKILDNAVADGDRRFSIAFQSSPLGTLNERPRVSVVIVDDEPAARPSVAIADHASAAEGNGDGVATVGVTLSAPSARTVSVAYHTVDGTAVALTDYSTVDAVLTFAPGETTKTISIPLTGDTLVNGDRTFSVVLTAPANATLGNATAAVTIVDDDKPEPPRPRPAH